MHTKRRQSIVLQQLLVRISAQNWQAALQCILCGFGMIVHILS